MGNSRGSLRACSDADPVGGGREARQSKLSVLYLPHTCSGNVHSLCHVLGHSAPLGPMLSRNSSLYGPAFHLQDQLQPLPPWISAATEPTQCPCGSSGLSLPAVGGRGSAAPGPAHPQHLPESPGTRQPARRPHPQLRPFTLLGVEGRSGLTVWRSSCPRGQRRGCAVPIASCRPALCWWGTDRPCQRSSLSSAHPPDRESVRCRKCTWEPERTQPCPAEDSGLVAGTDGHQKGSRLMQVDMWGSGGGEAPGEVCHMGTSPCQGGGDTPCRWHSG